jgi:RNA polymerase sigma factor (sigma-70 family)
MATLTFEEFYADYRGQLDEMYQLSGASVWSVRLEDFARAVWEGITPAAALESGSLPSLLKKIRIEELALALACARGNERAWEAFSFGYRNAVYDAARAFASDLTMARELTDSLTTELYGIETKDGQRRSKLNYYHGRSSLKTWLRAVVYQKFVDEYREMVRLEPLPEDMPAPPDGRAVSDKDEQKYAALLGEAVSVTLRELSAEEKLRLSYYYVQQLTLKQIGRITGQHEATVSRHLDSLRKKLRRKIEDYLRKIKKLSAYEIERCLSFESRGALFKLDKELKLE